MKQHNLKFVLFLLFLLSMFSLHPQQKTSYAPKVNEPLKLTEDNQRHFDETGIVRCATLEAEALRRQNTPSLQSVEEFENWLAPLVEERKQRIAQEINDGTYRKAQITIPIIFHVISGSAGDRYDISASQIRAQIDQLNLDFNNLSGSTYGVAASAGITFIPAMVDPNGNPLAEPGIHRVHGYSGAHSISYTDKTIKPATIWNRSRYANIWTVNLSGGMLGYAQFPINSTLPGIPGPPEGASTDGVVIDSGSVGSVAKPGTTKNYNLGRTLTHEMGHWIGLRHVWGDTTSCTNDDYCADTPDSTEANYGCPNIDRCTRDGLGRDMVQNYMDYSNDSCMNTFTVDQVSRILTVIEKATGISELPSSNTGELIRPVIAFETQSHSEPEGTDCIFKDVNIPLKIGKAPSANATITFSLSGTATNMVDYELLTPSITFNSGSTDNKILKLRIYEDGFLENDETIIINMTLSTTGDATLTTDGKETFTYTIINDDYGPSSGTQVTLLNENFESYNDFIIDNIGSWLTLDLDKLNTYFSIDKPTYPNVGVPMAFQIYNPATTTPSPSTNSNGESGPKSEKRNFNPRSGSKYAAAWAAKTGSISSLKNDDWLISPVLSLGASNSSVSFWVKSLSDSYGLEQYNVGVYVGTGVPTSESDFKQISSASETAPYGSWKEDTYDLSAYNNQNIRIGIHYISKDQYMFMVDDFVAITYNQNNVQTATNAETSATMHFSGVGEAYAYDSATNNIIARIQKTDSFEYGCADISVMRAGSGSQEYLSSIPSDFVMDKVFKVTTDNANSSGDVTLSFYFKATEIAGWESATGKNRSELHIIREVNGLVQEAITATISSYGTDVILTAKVTGINGNYYFGALGALSVVMLNKFSMFPNPVTNLLTIKTGNSLLPENYTVYNILGQVVLSNNIKNESDLLINTSSLNNGMYFIRLSQESYQVSLPFIKK